jgi:hypothetical protein
MSPQKTHLHPKNSSQLPENFSKTMIPPQRLHFIFPSLLFGFPILFFFLSPRGEGKDLGPAIQASLEASSVPARFAAVLFSMPFATTKRTGQGIAHSPTALLSHRTSEGYKNFWSTDVERIERSLLLIEGEAF